MSDFMDDRGGEMQELFFETAGELLQSLNECALRLEKHPGESETVREIRRIVHTLKGDAAACGLRELSELAHSLEDALALDLLDQSSLADVAFTAADVFDSMLDAYRQKTIVPSGEALHKLMRELIPAASPGKGSRKKSQAKTKAPIPTVWTEYETLAHQNALKQGKNVYHITATIDRLCAMPIAARQLLITALSSSGDILATRPEKNSVQTSTCMELLMASSKTGDQLSAKAKIPTVISRVEIVSLGDAPKGKKKRSVAAPVTAAPEIAEVAAPIAPAPELDMQVAAPIPEPKISELAQASSATTPENTLRVDAERIDNV